MNDESQLVPNARYFELFDDEELIESVDRCDFVSIGSHMVVDTISKQNQLYELLNSIFEDNTEYLRAFEQYLTKQTTLKEKTIRSHVSNASLFVKDYLVDREQEDVIQGITSLGMFFSYFYIRKCMWSTPINIKTTAESIKRFYKYLYEVNVIQKDDYQLLCNISKSDMESWQYECAVFNGDIEGDDEGLPFY